MFGQIAPGVDLRLAPGKRPSAFGREDRYRPPLAGSVSAPAGNL